MKKGTIIWIIILIALWAAWSRYYIKNNWEKIIDYWDWTTEVLTLKWWKIEWISTTYYEDWSTLKMNYKNWIIDWEVMVYYPSWNIKNRTIWKDGEIDYSKGMEAFYENWNYETLYTPDWQRTEYYENWQIKKEWIMNADYKQMETWKAYNEEWEQIAEWEYKNWEKWNWTFYEEQYDMNEDYEIEETTIIETYKDWELIETEEYNK